MPSDAIIFIPGVKGTKLVETNRASFDTIWSGIQSNFETIEDLGLTRSYNGQYYDEKLNTIVRAGEIEELAYGEFLHDLKTDKPIYIFNYDWRFSCKENSKRLVSFIDYLTEKTNAVGKSISTFDFITHSLGNFVLRNYIKREGFSKINKIVFTAPPFKGSIDIASAVLIGEGFFPNVKAKIRKLIRTFPGALELLPFYPGASRFDSEPTEHDFFNFAHWQKNATSPDNNVAEKFKAALGEAQDSILNELCNLSELKPDQRKRILILTRTGYETFQSIIIFKKSKEGTNNYFDFANACRTDNGDGRVPDISSCCYHKSILTLTIKDAFKYREYSHGFVLKDERVQKLVNRFLFNDTGKFKYNIPGGSVRKVKGLRQKQKQKKDFPKLPFWEIITD